MQFRLCIRYLFLSIFFGILAPNSVYSQQLSIDWTKPNGTLTSKHWGINDYQVMESVTANNSGFNAVLKTLNPGIIRIHHASITDTWTDSATRRWNVTKIRNGLRGVSEGYGSAKIILNIPGWPMWLSAQSQQLPQNKIEEFSNLCASLVAVMRDSIGVNVAYYEIYPTHSSFRC